MKAVQFAEYGSPDVLRVVDVAPPHAGAQQIRIAVRAVGVNPLDGKIRAGYMQQVMPVALPAIPGVEAAGVVDEVGEGVTGVAVGDAVFGFGSATYAEHAVLSSWAAKPAALSFEEAASFPVVVETALRIMNQVGVKPGQTLLVSGASGGVGSAVLQVARDRGIAVVATASERNQAYLRSLGATATTYGDGLSERVRALAPRVDAALDLAGSGVIAELIALTGEPRKVLSISDFTAPKLGAQVSTEASNRGGALIEAARLFTAGALHIPIDETFTLATAAAAQTRSAAGHVVGKHVLVVP
jgi:NADPH:quinone reductase-like Zn-dependent oxidoreductase